MTKHSDGLTDIEKKLAYAMGHELGEKTLIEKLLARWNAFITLRRIRSSKLPLRVIIRSLRDGEEVET